jgi:hypothetical protein
MLQFRRSEARAEEQWMNDERQLRPSIFSLALLVFLYTSIAVSRTLLRDFGCSCDILPHCTAVQSVAVPGTTPSPK